MMLLLVKLGDPWDWTLWGMSASLPQVQVTVPPTATVSTAGLDDPLWSLRKKMSPSVTAAAAGAVVPPEVPPPVVPPPPPPGSAGVDVELLLSPLQANRLAASMPPTTSIDMCRMALLLPSEHGKALGGPQGRSSGVGEHPQAMTGDGLRSRVWRWCGSTEICHRPTSPLTRRHGGSE